MGTLRIKLEKTHDEGIRFKELRNNDLFVLNHVDSKNIYMKLRINDYINKSIYDNGYAFDLTDGCVVHFNGNTPVKIVDASLHVKIKD